MAAVAVTLGLSIGLMPLVVRHQTKVRTHAGALARFYLDALLGLNAIRAHTAEAAIRREQEPLLVEWSRATLALIRALFTFEATQLLVGFGFATWLLKIHLAYGGEPGATLLLMYWALNYPLLGAEIASSITLHAEEKVVTLRLLEPLGQPEQRDGVLAPPEWLKPDGGMGISLRGVSVHAASHTVLDSIDLDIARWISRGDRRPLGRRQEQSGRAAARMAPADLRRHLRRRPSRHRGHAAGAAQRRSRGSIRPFICGTSRSSTTSVTPPPFPRLLGWERPCGGQNCRR